MRSIVFLLILALVSLQYKLWLGYGGIQQRQLVEQKIALQKAENQSIRSRSHALEADILELKSGEQALEEQARYELGMVKDNEVYYQFVE